MNKWYLRKIKNKYELYCIDDSFDDEAPILVLINILKDKYTNIIFKDEPSNIMGGEYRKKVIIDNIELNIYEELSSLTLSSDDKRANDIILEISHLLNAEII
ncbi:hypothetical protein [Brachyspira murdochii]|uniref:Uncharacterized protein n=1 Tax=Brachyspira murdochii (strain ATCC 51284 / DSM 12563 / 56-150) TaxID=526224 RepID=D5U7X2_BRAM5|nr:hypothetical protein [Brachyspira murdochii]ADG72918.1 hypothetical protein Bmur_2851 [Brachyspira murdochii DSM 12563]